MTIDFTIGDCVKVLKNYPENHFDSCVTDPPYGLEFMGKEWDKLIPEGGREDLKSRENFRPLKSEFKAGVGTKIGFPQKNPRCRRCGKLRFDHPKGKCKCESPDWNTRQSEYAYLQQTWHESWAKEVYRVLKPGAHLLAMGGTRTFHRLACALEDSGFEIRDTLMWLYGSGFPKSLDVSKAIDKSLGQESQIVRTEERYNEPSGIVNVGQGERVRINREITKPKTLEAAQWQGWGTALKPAYEPIILARKPLESTVAANTLKWHTGGMNIDECRVRTNQEGGLGSKSKTNRRGVDSIRLPRMREGEKKIQVHLSEGKDADMQPGVQVQNDAWESESSVEGRTLVGQANRLHERKSGFSESGGPRPRAKSKDSPSTGTQTRDGPSSRETTQTDRDGSPSKRTQDRQQARESHSDRLGESFQTASRAGEGDGAPTRGEPPSPKPTQGRWPANVILTHHPACVRKGVKKVKAGPWGKGKSASKTSLWRKSSKTLPIDNAYANLRDAEGYEEVEDYTCHPDCPIRILDAQSGERPSGSAHLLRRGATTGKGMGYGSSAKGNFLDTTFGDTGGASRFFYIAKASREERERGLRPPLECLRCKREPNHDGIHLYNGHPTVKPIELMRYLIRLITPPNGLVLDPFLGSGTTLIAARLEHMNALGIEKDPDMEPIIRGRLSSIPPPLESFE